MNLLRRIILSEFDAETDDLPVAIEDVPRGVLVTIEQIDGAWEAWQYDARNDYTPAGVSLEEVKAGGRVKVCVYYVPGSEPHILVLEKLQ